MLFAVTWRDQTGKACAANPSWLATARTARTLAWASEQVTNTHPAGVSLLAGTPSCGPDVGRQAAMLSLLPPFKGRRGILLRWCGCEQDTLSNWKHPRQDAVMWEMDYTLSERIRGKKVMSQYFSNCPQAKNKYRLGRVWERRASV